MERFSFVVVSALLFTGGLNLLQAQHGFGGHQIGGYSSGYSSLGTQYVGNPPLAYHSPLSNVSHPVPIGTGHPYSGYTGINQGVFSGRGDQSRNHGYGYGYGPLLYPYYLSTFDNSESPYPYGNPGPDPAMQNAEMTANALGEQISQLAAQIEALRNERNSPKLQRWSRAHALQRSRGLLQKRIVLQLPQSHSFYAAANRFSSRAMR